MKVLFVNACIRDEASRTLELCCDYLEKLKRHKSDCQITELKLNDMNLIPLDKELLKKRDELGKNKSFDDPGFDLANQFIDADHIVIGAPYWDFAFPAKLKIYLERCSVTGLTFIYNEKGIPEGQCKAKSLTYITTAGGVIGDFNFGYDYIKGLCVLFGIKKTYFAAAEKLDIIGNDVEALMAKGKEEITKIVRAM